MSSSFLLFAQHGWDDTHHDIQALARSIAPEPSPVIAPNLGRLNTWFRIAPLIQQVEQVVEQAIRSHPDHAWRIIGHSMGGLIWVEVLQRHPEWWPRIHSLALVGSPIGGSHLGRMIDPFNLGIAIAHDLGQNRREKAAAIARSIPTLVVAGDIDGGSDGTVTVECTKVPQTTFVVLPNIPHAKLKRHPLVGETIQSFWHQPQIPTAPASSTDAVIQKLRQVPGMTDAHYRHAHRGQLLFELDNGAIVQTWTNAVGVPHVFVISSVGVCLYGGYVGWPHRSDFDRAIAELAEYSFIT